MPNLNVNPSIQLPPSGSGGNPPIAHSATPRAGDAPAPQSFAATLSHAGRQHPVPTPIPKDPSAPSASAAGTQPAATAPPPTQSKSGGKKPAAAAGEDPPADGNSLPSAALAAAQIVSLLVAPVSAPAPAGNVDAGVAAATAAAPAPAPVIPSASAAPAPAAATSASPQPVQPDAAAAVPTVAGDSAKTAAPPVPSPPFKPPTAVPAPTATVVAAASPALPGPVATAAALPAPVVVAPPDPNAPTRGDERGGPSTPAAAAPAGTEIIVASAQTRRAVAAIVATDGSLDGTPSGSTADGKLDPVSASVASLAPPPAAAPAGPAVTQVAVPVGSSGWADQLGERVAVLVNQNMTNAQIKLSPAHLGPLEIRIAVADGQTSIAITTHSQVTREALEAAAPRLREVLGQQGLGSVSVDIAQQQFRERTPQSSHYDPEPSFAHSAGVTAPSSAAGTRAANSASRLDAYA